MDKQATNIDARTLLCMVIDEIIQDGKISNERETILKFYPSFYNKNIKLFGRVEVGHIFGLLFNIGMLKTSRRRQNTKISISKDKATEWNSGTSKLKYFDKSHWCEFVVNRERTNARQQQLWLSLKPNRSSSCVDTHQEIQPSLSDNEF